MSDQKPARSQEEVDRLVNDNMKLAWFFVNKYSIQNRDDQELLSLAMNGLLQAAIQWKESSGVPFGIYASLRIKWLFCRMMLNKTRKKRGAGHVHFSLDVELEHGGLLAEIVADPNARHPADIMAMSSESERIYSKLMLMPERERTVLEKRFGMGNYEPQQLEDIADSLGLTRERVRQIEKMALNRLHCLLTGTPFRYNHKGQKLFSGQKSDVGSAGSTKAKRLKCKQDWNSFLKRNQKPSIQ